MKRILNFEATVITPMDLRNFPFDNQVLSPEWVSISHWKQFDGARFGSLPKGQSYRLRPVSRPDEGKVLMMFFNGRIPEWELHSYTTKVSQMKSEPRSDSTPRTSAMRVTCVVADHVMCVCVRVRALSRGHRPRRLHPHADRRQVPLGAALLVLHDQDRRSAVYPHDRCAPHPRVAARGARRPAEQRLYDVPRGLCVAVRRGRARATCRLPHGACARCILRLWPGELVSSCVPFEPPSERWVHVRANRPSTAWCTSRSLP